MVGPVGFEPTTPRTSSECSTSELRAYTSVLLIVFSAPATCSSGSPSGQTTTLLLQRERVVRFYMCCSFLHRHLTREFVWSGPRESNPSLNLGKVVFYR